MAGTRLALTLLITLAVTTTLLLNSRDDEAQSRGAGTETAGTATATTSSTATSPPASSPPANSAVMIVDRTGGLTVHTWKGENEAGARMCSDLFEGSAGVFENGSTGDQPVIEPTTQIQFADLDGDGRDDYLLIDPYGTTRVWYNNGFVTTPGRGSFLDWTAPEQIAGADPEKAKYTYADINGDRRADRIKLTPKGGTRAWMNDGAVGAPATHREIGRIAEDSGLPPQDVQFADLDGDGRADLLRIGPFGVTHAWLNELPATYFDTFHP